MPRTFLSFATRKRVFHLGSSFASAGKLALSSEMALAGVSSLVALVRRKRSLKNCMLTAARRVVVRIAFLVECVLRRYPKSCHC